MATDVFSGGESSGAERAELSHRPVSAGADAVVPARALTVEAAVGGTEIGTEVGAVIGTEIGAKVGAAIAAKVGTAARSVVEPLPVPTVVAEAASPELQLSSTARRLAAALVVPAAPAAPVPAPAPAPVGSPRVGGPVAAPVSAAVSAASVAVVRPLVEPVAQTVAQTVTEPVVQPVAVVHEPAPVEEGDEPSEVPADAPETTRNSVPAAAVALVTGAGRGIGRAIALGLGAAGVHVALLGRSPQNLEDVAAEVASYGVGASWAGADVRDFAQVQHAVQRLEAALGEIDLLVNNAGVIEPVEVPIWDAGPETWWHVVETDLRGPFHCVRAVVPGMIERGGGRVVNLSSGTGAADREIYSAYAVAKAGLFRISGALHLAGHGHGLRSFEISPGVVRTDMTAAMPAHADRTDWTPVERTVELVVAAAQGRLDGWSGGFVRAGVDTVESLGAAELKAGAAGLPPTARRLGVLPYAPEDPLAR